MSSGRSPTAGSGRRRSLPRAGREAGYVTRSRLTDRLADARTVLVVAPSGYGKSSLADELAERRGLTSVFVDVSTVGSAGGSSLVPAFRRALQAAGLRSVADALGPASDESGGADAWSRLRLLVELLSERADPLLMVVDEADQLDTWQAGSMATVVDELPAPHQLLVIGQTEPGWAQRPRFADSLGPDDLVFSAAEVDRLARQAGRPLDPHEVTTLMAYAGGWPAAVSLAVRTGVTDPSTLRRGIGELVDRLLQGFDPRFVKEAAQLGQLPLISADVARAMGTEAGFETLVSSGVPLRRRPDGWIVPPEQMREHLRGSTRLPAARAQRAAEAYMAAGETPTALGLLLERREPTALLSVITRRPWQELRDLDPIELKSIVGLLPGPVLAANPGALLALARVAESSVAVEWRRSLIEQALASPALAQDAQLRRELIAERAADAARDGEVELALKLADEVLESAPAGEVRARARALGARGRAQAFSRGPGAIEAATEALTQAATLLRMVPESEWRANVLLRLGYGVQFSEGDLTGALVRTTEAVDAAPVTGRERANVLTFLADVLTYAGRLDEADDALREVGDVGRRLHDQRLLGYHAWMKASIASRRADPIGLATWLAETERHPGDWFAHPTGIEFLADAVDYWGRVGEHDRAAQYLARVEERCAADVHPGVSQIALVARAINAARSGDTRVAEVDLVAVLETEQLPRREQWRIHLLRGNAALRAGDPSTAAAHAARAFEEVDAMGHPELPAIHEPSITGALLPLVRATRSGARARAELDSPRIVVRILGGFSVSADGRPADPPPGRPATLVKLLAVRGAAVAVDEALEVLWPETDPDVGRARLRNVLARVRAASGDLIVREGNALSLAPSTVVDASDFERDARAALAGGGEADGLARRAVGRYSGELLPADRYEDFSASARERLALMHLALLDRLAAEAERAGDVDEALRLYGEAIAAAPLEEHRYELAAALADRSRRRQRAIELISQARRQLAELDVEPSPKLLEIERRLGRTTG